MLDQQITTESNMAEKSARFAPGVHIDVDIVDIAVLLSFEELQEDGGPDLVIELVELYLQDAPVKIDWIQRAVETADGAALKRAAHSLKGSSGTLGIRQVASVCEGLECLSDDALRSDAPALVQRLQQGFVRVQEVLTSELHRRSHEVRATTR